jgi:hypothetical protein
VHLADHGADAGRRIIGRKPTSAARPAVDYGAQHRLAHAPPTPRPHLRRHLHHSNRPHGPPTHRRSHLEPARNPGPNTNHRTKRSVTAPDRPSRPPGPSRWPGVDSSGRTG